MAKFRLNIPARENSERLRCAASGASVWNRRAYGQRVGLTLIELLITISIIATLSAIFVGASRSAMEAANAARTKSTISKLHSLLMEKWASYSTRRADINPDIISQIKSTWPSNPNITNSLKFQGKALQDARLLAIRQLIQMEIPDRWSDILGAQVPDVEPYTASVNPRYPNVLQNYPALTNSYLIRFRSLRPEDPDGPGPLTEGDVVVQNQGAECLYMIIMLATGDGEARTLFSPQDIGDTDGDGAPEFLDGWGQPIDFIRWPTGFVLNSALMTGDADSDHDPFDPFRRDMPISVVTNEPKEGDYPSVIKDQISNMRSRNSQKDPISGFRLVPLIYSRGPDGDSDLPVFNDAIITDPYEKVLYKGDYYLIGGPLDSDNDGEEWQDNIHNHLLDN